MLLRILLKIEGLDDLRNQISSLIKINSIFPDECSVIYSEPTIEMVVIEMYASKDEETADALTDSRAGTSTAMPSEEEVHAAFEEVLVRYSIG